MNESGFTGMLAYHSIAYQKRQKSTINAETSSLDTASLLSTALMTTKQHYFSERETDRDRETEK